MPFPLMFRADHDEIVHGLRAQNELLTKQYQQLYDSMSLEKFGVQVYGSFPKEIEAAMKPAVAPPEEEHHQETEEEYNHRRLVSMSRTSPSKVRAEISRQTLNRVMKQARAAHPSNFMTAVERTGSA